MSPTIGPPPPEPESCLVTSRVSSFKGGTLIDESVRDLETHERRLCDPDGYRPARCPTCGHHGVHVHCYRERRPRGDPQMPPVITIVQYICASEDCGATWRILPMFLARHLWRTWPTVERTVKPEDTAAASNALPVPESTKRRWRKRLASSARVLVVLLAASGRAALEAIAMTVGLDGTRATLVDAHAVAAGCVPGTRLSMLAGLVHRLERGIRLM